MKDVARDLATFLETNVPLDSATPRRQWASTVRQVSRVGDLVDMLGLPPGQTLFPARTITIEEVHAADGTPFEPNPGAAVLLLGDSFCNVFTLGQMGWGEAAGLAPHLARALRAEVDVIAQNDAGAFATRQLLWNELSNPEPDKPDRLWGKKVVIWEFASRELAVGNWKPLRWPPAPATALPSGPPSLPSPPSPPSPASPASPPSPASASGAGGHP
jgi:alginate O-acetyltransferase complex protein AlgJ